MPSLRHLAAVAAVALCVASAPSAQPTDLTPQQASVYESYRLSVEVRSRSGYVARPLSNGSYDITQYTSSSWRPLQGRRGMTEARFYEVAGFPDVASHVRREIRSDFLTVGLGAAMFAGAAGLGAVTNPDFTESGRPNVALTGVLFLGIGGFYLAYDGLTDAGRKKTGSRDAAAAANRYNAILLDEIRNAGPDAGAGGR